LTLLTFSFLLVIISYIAGLLGALTGLGGGVVLIPALVLLFKVDIHYAMGASLISVMATSSGAAIAYLRKGFTNIRIGMFLETGAVVGALVGATCVTLISSHLIAILFGLVLFISAYLTLTRKEEKDAELTSSHPWSTYLKLDGELETIQYRVQRVPAALLVMSIAGGLSGLLGIGSGALKVLAMDQIMRLPYKVSTTTSNFIIGITAATSAGIYFSHGYINPIITGPVLLGVLIGAITGTTLLTKLHTNRLRFIFSFAVILLGIEMVYQGLAGYHL